MQKLDAKDLVSYTREAESLKQTLPPHHRTFPTPAKQLPLYALYHNILHFVLPLCTTLPRPNPEVPITMSTNIIDISAVGLRQFWTLKDHVSEASALAATHYPEILDRTFVIGAPAFFPAIWSVLKHWFDPAKIIVLSPAEVKTGLEAAIHVDDIPRKYGGNLDWEFGDAPRMDPAVGAAVEKDGRQGWVPGPCLWRDDRRVPVGTVRGESRRKSD